MIENVAKSTRRKEVVDDAYMDKLYSDMVSLYRLNLEGGSMAEGKADLGKLPTASVALIATLATVWGLMIVYVVHEKAKKKRKS